MHPCRATWAVWWARHLVPTSGPGDGTLEQPLTYVHVDVGSRRKGYGHGCDFDQHDSLGSTEWMLQGMGIETGMELEMWGGDAGGDADGDGDMADMAQGVRGG